ncbi:MAG: DALR anticodon-binding domain-containing protein, partial [Elusimicrobiota bacterium]
PLEFDIELAKQDNKKNPVYYVQYSHARICSVFRKADIDPKTIDIDLIDTLGPEEEEVIKILAHFPFLLYKCAELKAGHFLTEYLRETATAFHRYYDSVRILGSEKEKARLLLLSAVREIIGNGLSLLGVSSPEVM